MALEIRRNPALLKLDLFCRGLHIDESLLVEAEGGRPVLRTRAGLGSGLELVLPGGHHVNVPVSEEFVRASPYVLRLDAHGLLLERDRAPVARVALAPRPDWDRRKTSTGQLMSRVVTLQWTCLRVYPGRV